jgi:hypothetical protein
VAHLPAFLVLSFRRSLLVLFSFSSRSLLVLFSFRRSGAVVAGWRYFPS